MLFVALFIVLFCCAVCCRVWCPPPAIPSRHLQELVKEVPGLFSLGPKGQLVVGEARQHEKQLEKVRATGGGSK